jgi:hypothetical protein
VRFQVLVVVSMKVIAFWDIAPCSLVVIALMIEAVYFSETSVYFSETTWSCIPEALSS